MLSGISCELICELLPLISAADSIAKYARVYTKGCINCTWRQVAHEKKARSHTITQRALFLLAAKKRKPKRTQYVQKKHGIEIATHL
jgi:hypothetical protein